MWDAKSRASNGFWEKKGPKLKKNQFFLISLQQYRRTGCLILTRTLYSAKTVDTGQLNQTIPNFFHPDFLYTSA
jgi:hypothetical protein